MSRTREARPPKVAPQAPGAPPAPLWVPLVIACLTFAAFLPALHNQLTWDDDVNLVDNPYYRGLGWAQLGWMWTTVHMGHWIPLTWMTFGLDYLLWGMKPLGYHLTSLLLHATNAVTFYFVALRILRLARPGLLERGQASVALAAGFAALLFALHPLRVESVAWATERRDVLSGLFYLAALLAYLHACERRERGRPWYWASVGLFACALLSKSIAVSLPVVLLILDVYPLRRLGGARGWWGEPARRVYVEKIPFVVLAAAASAVAFLALSQVDNMTSLDRLSVPDRLPVSAYGLIFYLWKMLVPLNLSPLYELPAKVNPWAAPFILSYGVVGALTALAVALRRRLLGFLAVWLAYVVILLPVVGIFHNGPQIAADRYTYLAGLGWAMLAGAGLLSSWYATRWLLAASAVCVLAALGVLTWHQVQVWQNSEKLWTHALAIEPNSSIAGNNLGTVLADQGKRAEAIEHYQRALRIDPNYSEAHNNWGTALADQGRLAEAIEHYRQALQIRPGYAEAHYNWGAALADQGRLAEAIEHYQQVLQIKPHHATAHTNWGVALARQGRPAEAIEHYQQALQINPNYVLAHTNWGNALAQQRKWAEAIEHYEQALRIDPYHAEAHNNWGAALADQGRLAEAIEHYRQALQIRPNYAEAHYNWGAVLAQQRKMAEAIEHYQRALNHKPSYAPAHNSWGVALAQQGRLAEAIAHFQWALKIRPDYADANRNLSVTLFGLVRARQSKPAEASEHFQPTLEIKPQPSQAQSDLLDAPLGQGRDQQGDAPRGKAKRKE